MTNKKRWLFYLNVKVSSLFGCNIYKIIAIIMEKTDAPTEESDGYFSSSEQILQVQSEEELKKQRIAELLRRQQILKDEQKKERDELNKLLSSINETKTNEDDEEASNNDIEDSTDNEKKREVRKKKSKYGTNIYIEMFHHNRLEIKLPWLEHGYDWNAHVQSNRSDVKKKHIKKIPHDLFHHTNAITKENGTKYCEFLNLELTDTNIRNCIEEINTFRDKYKRFIVEILYKFWFDIANKIGIADEDDYIFDSNGLIHSICSIQSEHDCSKLVLLLYIIFDWLGVYQLSIISLLEERFSIQLINPPIIPGKRRTLHCIHLLVTQMVTNERRILNDSINKTFGIRILLTKSDKKEKKMVTEDASNRLKKCVYPWMIRGNFVSIYYLFYNFKSYI